MKWIGFDRNDPNSRKFEFDDETILTSNPPKFEVKYIDNNEIGYIECSNVFKLKPVKNKQSQKPIENVQNNIIVEEENNNIFPQGVDEDIQNEILNELKPKNVQIVEPVVQKETVKKKPTRKKKEEIVIPTTETEEHNINIPFTTNHKYEYTSILDEFVNKESLEKTLNELGNDGWEMINFEIVPATFNSSKVFCILKRIKIN